MPTTTKQMFDQLGSVGAWFDVLTNPPAWFDDELADITTAGGGSTAVLLVNGGLVNRGLVNSGLVEPN